MCVLLGHTYSQKMHPWRFKASQPSDQQRWHQKWRDVPVSACVWDLAAWNTAASVVTWALSWCRTFLPHWPERRFQDQTTGAGQMKLTALPPACPQQPWASPREAWATSWNQSSRSMINELHTREQTSTSSYSTPISSRNRILNASIGLLVAKTRAHGPYIATVVNCCTVDLQRSVSLRWIICWDRCGYPICGKSLCLVLVSQVPSNDFWYQA